MDIQFWIWVIIIVITLIARATKKKAPQGPSPFDTATGEENTKPVSFEDLLREIQAAKAPKPVPQPAKSYDFEDYDDNLEDEIKPVERPNFNYNDDQIYETYEKAKSEAFNKASLEETMRVEDTVVRFAQFKGYQQVEESNSLNQYVQELKDPNGFKKAFIMSEILNRKF